MRGPLFRFFPLLSSLCLCASVVQFSYAHPVPNDRHDRTVAVRLTPNAVVVEYRLEVDSATAVSDLLAVIDKKELAGLSKPQHVYDAFARHYAPILANNLIAKLDDELLEFRCVAHRHEVLDHLRCDFRFEADCTRTPGRHRLTFRESNYETQAGLIRLGLADGLAVTLLEARQPGEELKGRAPIDWRPGDEERLRNLSASFEVTAEVPRGRLKMASVDESSDPRAEARAESGGAAALVKRDGPPGEHEAPDDGLLSLFLTSRYGFWATLFLAAVVGAAHALTPGHGKTLVAAYLVGQRGTAWHALFLGLVTTLTHTGIVLVLAAVLYVYFPHGMETGTRRDLQTTLGLVGGLLVACTGFWLLLCRLTGRADHVHLGGGPPHDPAAPVGWWGLTALGVSGGIVPCWDAILMLAVAVAGNLFWLALPMLLAFSAGLAGVLVLLGVLVVRVRGFAGSRWGESRAFRALPVVSAVLVAAIGLWLCYDAMRHADPPPGERAALVAPNPV